MNFVIEKYDSALKEALEDLKKSEKQVAAKSRLYTRKRREWQDEYERMAEKRERAIARRKIHKARADVAEADLEAARSTIETLEQEKAKLLSKMKDRSKEHKKKLDRLRESCLYEVTKERVKVETEMITKCGRRFANIRNYQSRRDPFDTARLLQSQAFGTKRCLEALKAGNPDIPQETINMFAAQAKQYKA